MALRNRLQVLASIRLNRLVTVQECDATKAQSGSKAGNHKLKTENYKLTYLRSHDRKNTDP
jgi:hypothetical protein